MLRSKDKETCFIVLILLVFALGFSLRFFRLGTIPPGLYVDEATIGYNAYSILKTGRDEWGKLFPLLFRSFGAYIMPVYIYSAVVPIALWGLSPFSVRFISALSGSLTIIFVFFLAREISSRKEKFLPVITALVFAISPWSVFFSRGAFEGNLALFFFVIGVCFFLKGLRHTSYLLVFSCAILGLSAYTYRVERLVVPLFLFLFFCLFPKKIIKDWKKIRFPLVIGLLVLLFLAVPQLVLLFSPAGQVRFQDIRILPDTPLFSLRVGAEALSQYTAYFSPRNLFFDPDPDLQRSLPALSVFYPWMALPYLIGLGYLLLHFRNFGARLTAVLLLVSPVAASLTSDPFSTLRSQPLLLPLSIVIGRGVYQIALFIKNRALVISGGLLLLAWSLISLYRSNFVLLPHERLMIWKYGFSELAAKLTEYESEKILIEDAEGTSYIELLFFLKYNPKDYQKMISPQVLANYYSDIDWNRHSSFANIQVRGIIWENDIYEHQVIVATPLAVSDGQAKEHFLEKIFTIRDPESKIIFSGFRTNPELKIRDDLRRRLKESVH